MMASISASVIRFFAAFLLSAFGYEFLFFVMTLYVFEISQNAFKVGIFAALTLAPRLFASGYGIIIDRYPRAKVLAAASGGVGLLLIAMVQMPSLEAIYVFWTLTAIGLTFVSTSRTALMTELMASGGYLRGNSLALAFLNLAKVGAPLLAGIASAIFRIDNLFYLTSGLYFLVMVIAGTLPPTVVVPTVAVKNVMENLREGLRYMRQNWDVRFLISIAVLWRLFIGLQISVFVVYVKTFLGGGDKDYGVFMMAIGVGSILGSCIGPYLARRLRYSLLAFWGLLLHYACFTLLGLLRDFPTALGVAFLGYVIFYATLVGLHSLRDRSTRIDMRGRVYGSVTAVLTPPAILSMLGGGYLADAWGVENVLVGAGLLAIGSLLLIFWRQNFTIATLSEKTAS